ncbi:hypothetical protein FKP32DRAFT_1598832 [Trametes sanguinea]|nr:hypothetical protein FKP32DRAFT_1598832 [Trametes sanguinea]
MGSSSVGSTVSQCQPIKQSKTLYRAALSPIERLLQQSLHLPDYRDVHLYAFTRRTVFPNGSTWIDLPAPVAAMSSILKERAYFRELLTSGFAETVTTAGVASDTAIRQYALPGEYEYDSDSDLEEAGFDDMDQEESSSPSRSASPAPPGIELKGKRKAGRHFLPSPEVEYRSILLPSVAYRTLSACVYYIYTEKINFLPLRSQDPQTRHRVLAASMGDGIVPPCSPKSMYRLADLYGMPELQQMAYDAILDSLTPENIVEEAFSSFFSRYERLREHAVSYLMQIYSDPQVEAALHDTLDKVAKGQLPHASGILRSLFGLRMALTQAERPISPPPSLSARASKSHLSKDSRSWF